MFTGREAHVGLAFKGRVLDVPFHDALQMSDRTDCRILPFVQRQVGGHLTFLRRLLDSAQVHYA